MSRGHVGERLSAYVDGDLEPKERERIEAHLEACAACRRQLWQLRQTLNLIRSLPEEEPPPSLRAAVMSRVRQEAERREERPMPAWTRWWYGARRRSWSLAVAAVVLMLAVGYVLQNRGDGPLLPGAGQAAVGAEVTSSDGGASSSQPQADVRRAPAPAKSALRAAAEQAAGSQSAGAAAGAADVAVSPGAAGVASQVAPFAGRKLIQQAHVTVAVDDVAAAFRAITQAVESRGGFIQDASLISTPGGRPPGGGVRPLPGPVPEPNAYLTVRVPAAGLTAFLDELNRLGSVEQVTTTSQDITQQYIDLEARLRTLRAQEERLLEILSRASSVEELLRVENELWRIREQIEQHQGQLEAWDRLVELATVTIELRPAGLVPNLPSGSLFGRLVQAWYQALDAMVTGFEYIVIGAGALLPWALLGLLGWWGYRRLSAGGGPRES